MFNDNENPYAPPSCPGCGEYDWSLAKRVFLTVSAIAILHLLIVASSMWQAWNGATIPVTATAVEKIKAFFFGWKSI